MPVLPGAPATFRLTLVAADTLQPISGQTVTLDQFDPTIGTFRPVSSMTTGGDGAASTSFALPSAPGRYRYRAAFKGSPEFRADNSPESSVEVKAPAV